MLIEELIDFLVDEMKDHNYDLSSHPQYIKKSLENLDQDSKLRISRYIFKDFRYDGRSITGKRLSKEGCDLLSIFVNSYKFTLEDKIPSSLIFPLFLNKNCKFPYYLDSKTVVFFEEHISVMYRLYGSKIKEFIDLYQE